MALAPLLYNITFDSQTRILYFWDKAGHEIYHCVIASPAPAAYDTATGTISEITLPSAHSYIDVTFDSLRYYVKGTVSNIGQAYISGSYWYYGTVTWTDSSLGDLSSKIRIADPSDPNWLSTSQDVFRILFITEGIVGYSPDFTGYTGGGQITAYSYNNGVHSITCYLSTSWANYTDSGRIRFKYLDDTTTFNNLSAFDLVTISNGVLSKDTTTDRYAMYNAWNGSITVNAKYIPSPAPSLPTVSMSYTYPNQLWNYSENIGAGGSCVLRDQNGNALSYDSTKSYSALNYYTSTSDSAGTIDTNVSIGASGSFLALFNNGSSQITVQRVNVATCNSTDATVITVYDSSNNPYNAFKYTLNGTDYYYVLDGTQTDWTDDLASIGYGLQQIYTAWVEANKSQGQVSSYLNSYMYNNSGSFYLYKYNTEYSIISIDGDRTSENIQKLELYNTLIADPYRLGLRVKAGIEGLVVNLTYIEFTMTPRT